MNEFCLFGNRVGGGGRGRDFEGLRVSFINFLEVFFLKGFTYLCVCELG